MELSETDLARFRNLAKTLGNDKRFGKNGKFLLRLQSKLSPTGVVDLIAAIAKIGDVLAVQLMSGVWPTFEETIGPEFLDKLNQALPDLPRHDKRWKEHAAFILRCIWDSNLRPCPRNWKTSKHYICQIYLALLKGADRKSKDKVDIYVAQGALGFWGESVEAADGVVRFDFSDLFQELQKWMPFAHHPKWMAQLCFIFSFMLGRRDGLETWMDPRPLVAHLVSNYPTCIDASVFKSKLMMYDCFNFMGYSIWKLCDYIDDVSSIPGITAYTEHHINWLLSHAKRSFNHLSLLHAHAAIFHLSEERFLDERAMSLLHADAFCTIYRILESTLSMQERTEVECHDEMKHNEKMNILAPTPLSRNALRLYLHMARSEPDWCINGLTRVPFVTFLPRLQVLNREHSQISNICMLVTGLLMSDPSRRRYSLETPEFAWILETISVHNYDNDEIDLHALLISALAWYFVGQAHRFNLLENAVVQVLYATFCAEFEPNYGGIQATNLESRFPGIGNIVSMEEIRAILLRNDDLCERLVRQLDEYVSAGVRSMAEAVDILLFIINFTRHDTIREFLPYNTKLMDWLKIIAVECVQSASEYDVKPQELSKLLLIAFINISKDSQLAKSSLSMNGLDTFIVEIMDKFISDRDIAEYGLWAIFNMNGEYHGGIRRFLRKDKNVEVVVRVMETWKHDPRVASRGCRLIYILANEGKQWVGEVDMLRCRGAFIVSRCAASPQMKKSVLELLGKEKSHKYYSLFEES